MVFSLDFIFYVDDTWERSGVLSFSFMFYNLLVCNSVYVFICLLLLLFVVLLLWCLALISML